MVWTDIRRHYPHQWLLVEALLARSKAGKRQLDEMAVVDAFPDGETALRAYLKLHRDAPQRELYVDVGPHEGSKVITNAGRFKCDDPGKNK
jgi:hypothetical protein